MSRPWGRARRLTASGHPHPPPGRAAAPTERCAGAGLCHAPAERVVALPEAGEQPRELRGQRHFGRS